MNFYQTSILEALMESDLRELSFMDYLVYMPLFLGIHEQIVSNPLGMQKRTRIHKR